MIPVVTTYQEKTQTGEAGGRLARYEEKFQIQTPMLGGAVQRREQKLGVSPFAYLSSGA